MKLPKVNKRLIFYFFLLPVIIGVYSLFFPNTVSAYWDCIPRSEFQCTGGQSMCDVYYRDYPWCENLICGPVPDPYNCLGQCCRWEPDPSPSPSPAPSPSPSSNPSPSPSPAGCQNNAYCGVCKQCCAGSPNYCTSYGYYCAGGQIPGCWASPSPSPSPNPSPSSSPSPPPGGCTPGEYRTVCTTSRCP